MNDNEYMRKYMLNRYNKRISEAKVKLGGKCVKCGAINDLEFDHIDKVTKSFTIAGSGWNANKTDFDNEINKCQLLCVSCHEEKTLVDFGRVSAKNTHGTLSSYRYCRCDLCKTAKSNHAKAKRLEKKNNLMRS